MPETIKLKKKKKSDTHPTKKKHKKTKVGKSVSVELQGEVVDEATHVFIKKEIGDPEEEVEKISEKSIGKKTVSTEKSEPGILKERAIEQKLTEIYENSDGSMPDMHTFTKQSRNGFLTAFFVLLSAFLVFGATAWVGFFIIQPRSSFSEDDVILTVSGDEEVRVGEEVTYRIRYKNAQGILLQNASLEIRYPKGFVYTSSTVAPTNELGDTWKLGSLGPHASGYIDISGILFGDAQGSQSLRAFLNYQPENFSSTFQRVSYITVSTGEPVLDLSVAVSDPIIAHTQIPIDIKIIPVAPIPDLKKIIVSCESEYLSISKESSQPKLFADMPCTWEFETIAQEQTIHITGSFAVPENISTTTLTFVVQGRHEDGNEYLLAKVSKEYAVKQTDIGLTLAINGVVGQSTVQPGEVLNSTVTLKNNGETVMKDVVLRLLFDAPSYQNRSMLSWQLLDISHDADVIGEQLSSDVRRGIVVWDKRYISELAELQPGEEITATLSLPIKSGSETSLSNYVSPHIVSKAEISYTENENLEIKSSNEIELKLISDTKLDVRDELSEDVGGNTVHTVTWLVSNSYHALENIVLKADVYGDVEVDTQKFVVPAGEVLYDEVTKKIEWKIDTMPLGVDVLAFQFEIVKLSHNPTQTQLTSRVVLTAEDTVTHDTVRAVGDEILLQE